MRVLAAPRALLFDVGNLPVRRDFPVVASDAAAAERREAEETNKTHHGDPPTDLEQFLYRRIHTRNQKCRLTVATVVSKNLGVFCLMADAAPGTKTGGSFPARQKPSDA